MNTQKTYYIGASLYSEIYNVEDMLPGDPTYINHTVREEEKKDTCDCLPNMYKFAATVQLSAVDANNHMLNKLQDNYLEKKKRMCEARKVEDELLNKSRKAEDDFHAYIYNECMSQCEEEKDRLTKIAADANCATPQ
jgi:hypothetical protein